MLWLWIKYLLGLELLDITPEPFLYSNHPKRVKPLLLHMHMSLLTSCGLTHPQRWGASFGRWNSCVMRWPPNPQPCQRHGKWQCCVGGKGAASSILKGDFLCCAARQGRSSGFLQWLSAGIPCPLQSHVQLQDAQSAAMSLLVGSWLGPVLPPGFWLSNGGIGRWCWKKQMIFGASWSC